MATVDIIIRMIDQTGGGSSKVSANLKGMATSLAATSAAALAVGAALKKVYDVGREGAQLELTKIRFDRLAESIGTTSDVLMNDLRDATRGLYSDMELAASATDFMALGLAKTQDEAVRLAAVSAGLNMNMNQLVLTLTNMTTMRFDALGVSVDGFKEKVKELEKAGMSTEAAFKEAFLQQAENQLEKVGHAADTTAGSFMRFEAEVKNLTDAMKQNAAEGLAPLLPKLTSAVEYMGSVSDEVQDNVKWWEKLIPALAGVHTAIVLLKGDTNDYSAAIERGTAMTKFYSKQLQEVAEVSEVEITPAIQEMTKEYTAWLDLVGRITDEQKDHQESMDELQASYAAEAASLVELTKTRWWDVDAIEEQKSKMADIQSQMEEETTKFEENTRRRVLSMLEEQLAAGGLSEAEMQYLEGLGLQWGIYTESAVESAQAVRSEVADLVAQFEALPTEKRIQISIETAGGMSSLIGQGFSPVVAAAMGYSEGTNGWKTVPPGYSGDSYPVMLSSGEAFSVIPAGETKKGVQQSGGDMGIIPILKQFADEIARSNRTAFEKSGRR